MTKKETFWHKVAKVNIVKNRMSTYLNALNFIMIAKVFMETFDNKLLGAGLLCAGGIVFIILAYVDWKFIFSPELEIAFQKNTEWRKFRDGKNGNKRRTKRI